MRIVKFLLVNLIGFFAVTFLTFMADSAGLIPRLPPDYTSFFQQLFFGGTMGAWVIGALLSTLYFLVKGVFRLVFLSLPVLIPVLYGGGVLAFFN